MLTPFVLPHGLVDGNCCAVSTTIHTAPIEDRGSEPRTPCAQIGVMSWGEKADASKTGNVTGFGYKGASGADGRATEQPLV